eukprot:3440521-Pleurochrysis_carterae.AAC.1
MRPCVHQRRCPTAGGTAPAEGSQASSRAMQERKAMHCPLSPKPPQRQWRQRAPGGRRSRAPRRGLRRARGGTNPKRAACITAVPACVDVRCRRRGKSTRGRMCS